MRESSWRIEWAATGESPTRLLDHGDLMPEEIGREGRQAHDIGRPDLAIWGTPAGRANAGRTLSFRRIDDHDTQAESWAACHAAVLAAPWGVRDYLSVRPEGGVARFYLAALTSSSHVPLSGGPGPRTQHGYDFMTTPVSAVVLPGGTVVIGGYYNSPEEYFLPDLPPGVGIPDGGTIEISGPGGGEGPYVVGGGGVPSGGGGAIPVTPVDPENPEEPEELALVSAPVISGDPYVGSLLNVVRAVFAGAETVTGFWYFNGVSTGNSSSSYTIPPGAVAGNTITFRETATQSGSTPINTTSNTITVAELPFVNLSPPSIAGTPLAGETLNRTPGSWQSADSVTGEWYLNGVATGETGPTYNIDAAADVADEIFYRETAVKSGETNLTEDSNTLTVVENVLDVVRTKRSWMGGTLEIKPETRPSATSLDIAGAMYIPDGTYAVTGSPSDYWTAAIAATSAGAAVDLGLVEIPWGGTPLAFSSIGVNIDWDMAFSGTADGASYAMGGLGLSSRPQTGTFEAGVPWSGGSPGSFGDERPIDSLVTMTFDLRRNGTVVDKATLQIRFIGTVKFILNATTIRPVVESGITLEDTLYGGSATAVESGPPVALSLNGYTREHLLTLGTVTPS